MDRVEDRISELPDDILVSLMSPMGLKEAAKTSILSQRWRYQWAKLTHLDFNHLVVLPERDPDVRNFNPSAVEKSKYINWVNQVVDVHCSPCIDTFKVSFYFDISDAHHIHKWMRFAISKKVKDLEVESTSFKAVHTFGFDILKPSLSPGASDISFLRSLCLTKINVSGEVLEFLLSRCHLLERLDVRYSQTLVRFKVVGLSCKLKQLTIHRCCSLEELEIDATNLIYLDFFCANNLFNLLLFKSAPVLAEVKVVGWAEPKVILPPIFQLAGQISKLSISLQPCDIPRGLLPIFSHLKLLNLWITYDDDVEIDHVAIRTLLEACPEVCEFKLEICWTLSFLREEAYRLVRLDPRHWSNVISKDVEIENVESDMVPVDKKTHRNLKVVHVVGFSGADADVELILYFVEMACNPEMIICDPRPSFFDWREADCIEASRSRAAKLNQIVPPQIRVLVI